jgi:transposase
MTDHDLLYGYRLQLFDLAVRTTVANVCRVFNVHRSTYYRWKRQVDRHGLEMLRPWVRRRPRMPNQLSAVVEQRIVAFSLGHPAAGPDRISAELARPKWDGVVVSPNGVWRVLRRHGLNTPAKRLGMIAAYAAPYEPPGPSPRPARVEAPRRAGRDRLLLRRPPARRQAPRLASHRHRLLLLLCLADLVTCPTGQPLAAQTSRLTRRVAQDLARRGRRLERVLTDNGNECAPR